MVLMPGFQSTRLATDGALEPFYFLYTDDSIQGNPETCKQSSIMLNYEIKNNMWTEVQTDEQDETMKKSEEEVYDLLVKHYEEIKNNGEVDSSAVVMTGSMENDRQYFTMVRCGVPGNPSASQLLYSVIVDVYTGEVIQTRELTDGKVETFYLW